jgi:alkanesulfonate monooxygenase SsuD/methylene tetrahydromethanopterin reductase-like flavin-dependent oxidoreductase (luciferase family)
MKVDFYFPPGPPREARSAAEYAARLGFDGFFSAETSHDPFFPLLLAAEAAPISTWGPPSPWPFPARR